VIVLNDRRHGSCERERLLFTAAERLLDCERVADMKAAMTAHPDIIALCDHFIASQMAKVWAPSGF